jgi:oligopeptide/dipeptide ABC transporter ATP-binding protein
MSEPIVDIRDVVKTFKLPRTTLREPARILTAVNRVSMRVEPREMVGIVGESGSGKSTLGRIVVGLEHADSGDIHVAGHDVRALKVRNEKPFRRDVQMVFQDPLTSLDPRMTIRRALLEPLRALEIQGDHKARIAEVLEAVHLPKGAADKYPHEFSGGQLQRVVIARALALRPKLLVADEPVSALDLSVQAQILNLLMDLRDEFGLAVLIIAHDLSVVHQVADRVVVMTEGEIVEKGPVRAVFDDPRHPYSERLLSAIIRMDGEVRAYRDPAVPLAEKPACPSAPRCPYRQEICLVEKPPLESWDDGGPNHLVACHFRDQPLPIRPRMADAGIV